MSFAVLLHFDASTERAILSIQEKLLRRGVHPIPDEMRSRPHLTLGVWNGKVPPGLLERLEALAGSWPAKEILLGSAGVFPNREGVLFLAPVASGLLLGMHERLHAEMAPAGLDAERKYLPGSWIPHVTVAISLADWEMRAGIDIVREEPMPIRGRIVEVGVIEYPPVREVAVFGLMQKG